jgi:hypothetical protein
MPNGQSIVSIPSSAQFGEPEARKTGGIRGWFSRDEGQHDSKTCTNCGTKFCTHCGGKALGKSMPPDTSCPSCGAP